MFQPIQLVAVLASLTLVALVLDLIRRRRMKEELWFAWLLASLGPLVCSLWLRPWATVAHWLGLVYEPALLMMAGIFFALGVILYLSTVVSALMRQNQRMAQELAFLAWRLDRVQQGGVAR
jgi:hypothetical protein